MQKTMQKNISAGALPISVSYHAYGKRFTAKIILANGHYGWGRHSEGLMDSLSLYLPQGKDLAAELGKRGVILTPEGKQHVDGCSLIFESSKAVPSSISKWPLLTDMPDEFC